jgi:hypothetical protein
MVASGGGSLKCTSFAGVEAEGKAWYSVKRGQGWGSV